MAAGARVGFADGLVVVGAAVSVAGVSLLSVPAAVILAGVLLVSLGVLLASQHG